MGQELIHVHGIKIRTDIVVENVSSFLNKQYSRKVLYMPDGFSGREGRFQESIIIGEWKNLVAWEELTLAFRAL